MAFLQFVIGYLRAEVMNVMEANVACEPLQNFGKFIKGATVHTGVEETPILVAFPIGRLKVVLHVEQPHARARRLYAVEWRDPQSVGMRN